MVGTIIVGVLTGVLVLGVFIYWATGKVYCPCGGKHEWEEFRGDYICKKCHDVNV